MPHLIIYGMVACRQCGVDLFSKEQAAEMKAEIQASSASMEDRMSDIDNLDLCDDCLRATVMDELYNREEDPDHYMD